MSESDSNTRDTQPVMAVSHSEPAGVDQAGPENGKSVFRLHELPSIALALVFEFLPYDDLKSMSLVNDDMRYMCAPRLYRTVGIREGVVQGCTEVGKFMDFMKNRGAADFRPHVKTLNLRIDHIYVRAKGKITNSVSEALQPGAFPKLSNLNIRLHTGLCSRKRDNRQHLFAALLQECDQLPALPNIRSLAFNLVVDPYCAYALPDITSLISKCSNLRVIRLDGNLLEHAPSTTHALQEASSRFQQQLEGLQFARGTLNVWFPKDLQDIATMFPNLRILVLEMRDASDWMTPIDMATELVKMPRLEKVTITVPTQGDPGVDYATFLEYPQDLAARRLFSAMPRLKQINLITMYGRFYYRYTRVRPNPSHELTVPIWEAEPVYERGDLVSVHERPRQVYGRGPFPKTFWDEQWRDMVETLVGS